MKSPGLVIAGAAILIAGLVAAESVTIVQPSTVDIKKSMGHLDPDVLREGPHLVAPWATTIPVSTSQQYFTVSLPDVQSKDKLKMVIAVTFQFRKNGDIQPVMYEKFKGDDENSILRPAATSALRDAASLFTADEATGDHRDDLVRAIQAAFNKAIQANLISNGLSPAQAQAAYIIPQVQLQTVTPPDRILEANAEKQASNIDLQRQSILTQIAHQQASRQEMQGEGVRKMFDKLPAGYSAKDVYYILAAITLKENADSFYRAVESGKVTVYPVPQSSPMTIPNLQ